MLCSGGEGRSARSGGRTPFLHSSSDDASKTEPLKLYKTKLEAEAAKARHAAAGSAPAGQKRGTP